MAYRRGIAARARLFYEQQQRVAPSICSHIISEDNDREELYTNPNSTNSQIPNYFQHRFFGTGNNFSTYNGSRNLFQDRRFAIPAGFAPFSARNFSSGNVGEGAAADKIEILNDVVDVVGDKAAEVAGQVAPVVSEVTIAAADSFFPVAALQYLIDYIHSSIGLPWCAAIALTTIVIRLLQLPLLVNQMKATSIFNLLTPQLKAIKKEMQNRGMSPAAVDEGHAQMKKLFKEYGVTPFSPMMGTLISGPVSCSFFFAITKMAEKVPSFKEGGILWFTDLTTPDAMYIFPVLMALTFWITVEYNPQLALEGSPTAGLKKNVSRAFAALTIPLTASFPKAIFCYWMTSSLFSLAYGLVIKKPEVKKMLGIPIIPMLPPSTEQPAFSFFEAPKKYAVAQQLQLQSLSSPTEPTSKPTYQRIASSSVLKQRIKSLEREVKGRKKGKKR